MVPLNIWLEQVEGQQLAMPLKNTVTLFASLPLLTFSWRHAV